MNEQDTRRYFAASNSASGFQNYYAECFSEARVSRLYIIKGGPGTGKSHFMRAVAHHARGCGYRVTEYECSSDPTSLDGVLLQKGDDPARSASIGLVDGTAPHVCEPTVPGVREEMVDLGAFWDSDRLSDRGDEIRALAACKSGAYARAYAYLRAAAAAGEVAEALLSPAVREERLRALADRLLRHQAGGQQEDYEAIPALRRAVSMGGRVTRHTFEDMAESLLVLEPAYGMGYRLTRHMMALSRARGHKLLVSYDPIYPERVDGLFYPASGLCVLVGDAAPREGCPTRTLSLRRYLDPALLRPVRAEIRHATGMRKTLEEDALRALAEAGKYHFALENIYADTMDFAAKEAFTERFLGSIR